MSDATDRVDGPARASRWRLLFVAVAIWLGQAVLFGPSLVGSRILLPLDILGQRNHYLPHAAGLTDLQPENYVLSDQVLHAEPTRRFAAEELRAGRFPLWNPYEFAGVPHVLMRFSPFMLLRTLTTSPLILPWVQVLVAMLAGLGFYAFCRKTLLLSFWPSAVAAWCYPLGAYFVLWQGYGHTWSLAWLPWLLLTEDAAIRRKHRAAGLLVAPLTFLTLVSGPLDTGAQELMVAGGFAVWVFFATYGRDWRSRPALRAGSLLVLGWSAGLLLTAPEVLSTAAYAKTSARVARRSHGALERPPAGLAALPLMVLPNLDGTTKHRGVSIAPAHQKNQMEGAAMGYVGVLAVLLLVPLAWQSRRHRQTVIFFTGLAIFGLGWVLNLPGITTLLRLPGLNLMSHNRLLFATSLSFTAMAAIGLEAIQRGEARWRAWQWAPAVMATVLCLLGASRTAIFPHSLAARIEAAISDFAKVGWQRNAAAVEQTRLWFGESNAVGAVLCGLTAIAWVLLRRRGVPPRSTIPILGIVMAADLLCFGHGWNVQSDPRLYYPRIPVLEQIARTAPGRVVGYDCLPAVLAQTHRLRDIRGYDAVDPQRVVSLLEQVAAPGFAPLPYAAVQWYTPTLKLEPPAAVRLPPVLDMLGVRTMIFRGTPPAGLAPRLAGGDYWTLDNPRALPRVFVPRHVEVVADAKERLRKLASPEFDAREVAYAEAPISLPTNGRGRADITSEIPTRITIAASMETPGLVVLADRYDAGWQTLLNGEPVPTLRVNHAVRGIVVPAGDSRIELRYWPTGFTWGFRLAGAGLLALLIWSAVLLLTRKRADGSTA